MVILKIVFLFTIPLPELYPVSVLRNFTSALLTGCVTVILQMIKTSSQLMGKHSGEEIRFHIVCDVPDELIDFTFEWKGLKKLCVAVSFRSIIAEQKKEPEMTVRYYISSADLTAEKFATAIRNHWHVENKLHWRLDVVMNEDDCKIRRGNAAELFSGRRYIAINILTNEKIFKAGLRRKMRKTAMDRNYLGSVLAGSGLS